MTGILVGLAAGCAGGFVHLAVLAARARFATDGWVVPFVLLAPLGLLGPVAALGLAIAVEPKTAWSVLPGLLLARVAWMTWLHRRERRSSWTS